MDDNTSIIVNKITKSFNLNHHRGILHSLKKNPSGQHNNIMSLNDVSFSTSKGETLGIIGLNGSGKTTLLKIISGIYTPDFGDVSVFGKLAPLLHLGSGFQGDLTAYENIILYGLLLGLKKSDIKSKTDDILAYAELDRFSNTRLKNFSAGMRARLGFATATQINSDILLLDEILSVGDRIFREKSFEVFLNYKKNKKTILFTTHNLEMLSEHSDRVLLLDKGKIIKLGDPDDVISFYKKIK